MPFPTSSHPCIVILALSSLSSAHASSVSFEFTESPIEIITSSSLKIIGRGIVDRKSGDSFALACSGPTLAAGFPDCSQLRHVYFNSRDHQASYYGDTYELDTSDQTQTDPTRLKADALNRDFKTFKRSEHKERNIGMMVAVTIGGGTAIALAPYLLPVSFTVAKIALALNWVLSVPIIYQYGIGGQMFMDTAQSTNAFQDQNGWNWALQPRKLSHSTFELYRKFLDHRHRPTIAEVSKEMRLEHQGNSH